MRYKESTSLQTPTLLELQTKKIEKENKELGIGYDRKEASQYGATESKSKLLHNYYPEKDGNWSDQYSGRIAEGTIRGGQYSTAELDKMLAEQKHQKNMFIARVTIISFFVLLIIFSLIKFLRRDKTVITQKPKEENISSKELEKVKKDQENISSDIDSVIERIEKLNNLKESGAITDLEFEQMKKKAISNNK